MKMSHTGSINIFLSVCTVSAVFIILYWYTAWHHLRQWFTMWRLYEWLSNVTAGNKGKEKPPDKNPLDFFFAAIF